MTNDCELYIPSSKMAGVSVFACSAVGAEVQNRSDIEKERQA